MVFDNAELIAGDRVLSDSVLHQNLRHTKDVFLFFEHFKPKSIVVALADVRNLEFAHFLYVIHNGRISDRAIKKQAVIACFFDSFYNSSIF